MSLEEGTKTISLDTIELNEPDLTIIESEQVELKLKPSTKISLMNNQDFVQKISIVPIVLVELYRVMVSSFLILFVPQKCVDHVCTLNENLVLDSQLYNTGLTMNFITAFFFTILYILEIKRENRLITYLHVSNTCPTDNNSVGEVLNLLPIDQRSNILYLDKAYQQMGYFVMLLFEPYRNLM